MARQAWGEQVTSYKIPGLFSDYEIRESMQDDGSVRISFHMSKPPRRFHSEIWSWTGNPKALAPAAGKEGTSNE